MILKRIFVFLPFISIVEAGAQASPKSYGKSLGESFVYKSKKSPVSIADKDKDILSYLKLKDSARTGAKSAKQQDVGVSEVYTLETVNGEPITNIDVINVAKLMFFFSGKTYDHSIAKMMFPVILSSLEDDRVRAQCAKFAQVKVSEKDTDTEIARLAQMNGIDEQELEKRLTSFGLGMNVLRQHIKSNINFRTVYQYIANESNVSKADLETERKEQQDLIASKRYCIVEIFRYDEASASKIRQLVAEGFDFQVMAENLAQSQGGDRGAPKWYKASNMELEVAAEVSKMAVGEMSKVIKTKSGYKLVKLLDTGAPGKAAQSEAAYKFFKSQVVYNGKLFTNADKKKLNETLEQLVQISDIDKYKEFCKQNNIQIVEESTSSSNPEYMGLVAKSKGTGKPVIAQSKDDPEKLDIVMFASEALGTATMPSDDELKTMVYVKKMAASFARSYKRLKDSLHIRKNDQNIQRLTR